VGRVALAKTAEPVDWFEIESGRQEISGCCRFSRAIGSSIAPTNDPPAFVIDDSAVSLPFHQDIHPNCRAAIATSNLSQGQTTR